MNKMSGANKSKKKCKVTTPSRNRIFHMQNLLSKKDMGSIIDRVHSEEIYDQGPNYESRHYFPEYMDDITKKIRAIGDDRINNILDIIDESSDTHATCYRNTDNSMESHYDGWSDWNLLLAVGDSSDLITGRDKLTLHSGDIVLFNGGKIRHQVRIHKGNGIRGSKYRRITIQHRHNMGKELKAIIKNINKYPPRYE
jgi:hypothetical protein